MLGGKDKITGGERCRCFVIPFSISFSIFGCFLIALHLPRIQLKIPIKAPPGLNSGREIQYPKKAKIHSIQSSLINRAAKNEKVLDLEIFGPLEIT
jgi:hypothetical protein